MRRSKSFLVVSVAVLFAFACPALFAQASEAQQQAQSAAGIESAAPSAPQPGVVMGTVADVNGSPVSGATVLLQTSEPAAIPGEALSVTTNESGFFEIRDVQTGRPYQVVVRSDGFSEWQSPAFTLEPGQSKIVDVANLQIKEVQTVVTVTPESTQEIAIEQVKTEEKQRGFAIIPNFYAAYDSNPAPMTTGLKFRLALRVARDPFTLTGVAFLAGIGQAAHNPDYVEGAKGYAERLGASYANNFTDIMLEGAVLPSLFHQDPRYFYKGTGSDKSRVAHVFRSLFVTKGDNGNWQPNYSMLGGAAASAGLQNLYYPPANRGAGSIAQTFGTTMAIHTAVRMLDEFVFRPAKGSVAN
jgi:hypothetical protein